MAQFKLKPGMLLGVATAATQIEGGDENNSWYDWYRQGKISDGSSPARANDHYVRWREDLQLMKDLKIQIYRFGVEWSRIEPENGRFDDEVLAHYREELLLLRELGIAPLLTLHHFTNPLWFEKMGGFENKSSVHVFLRFVDKILQTVGDLVSEYITINEPNVYATSSYAYGAWPPGKKSYSAAMLVMSRMAVCHIKAYELIHRQRAAMGFNDTKVGFANHLRVFAPQNPSNPRHRAAARLSARLFQGSLTRAMCTGRFELPLFSVGQVKPGKYYDFHGINYYSRSTVSGIGDGVRAGAPVNDLGWEIYPQGIVDCASEVYTKYPAPIYITENGTCDNADKFRSRYIFEHLQALCASDLPVERYYHWCFCDNFEWLEGESARFGLVHVDFASQKRTVKDSGRFFAEIIAAGGVSEELYEKHARQTYHLADGGEA